VLRRAAVLLPYKGVESKKGKEGDFLTTPWSPIQKKGGGGEIHIRLSIRWYEDRKEEKITSRSRLVPFRKREGERKRQRRGAGENR